MEKLVAMMVFCEAPLDGTFDGISAPSSGSAEYGTSATGDGNKVALLDAAAKKWPVERLMATMAFCDAPFDGTTAPSSGAARYGASATGGGNKVALLDAAAKKWPVERLVATMAFCEVPFDDTFNGTSAPKSGSAGGSSTSATNVPGDAGGGGDGAALRQAKLAYAKQWPLREHLLLLLR